MYIVLGVIVLLAGIYTFNYWMALGFGVSTKENYIGFAIFSIVVGSLTGTVLSRFPKILSYLCLGFWLILYMAFVISTIIQGGLAVISKYVALSLIYPGTLIAIYLLFLLASNRKNYRLKDNQ